MWHLLLFTSSPPPEKKRIVWHHNGVQNLCWQNSRRSLHFLRGLFRCNLDRLWKQTVMLNYTGLVKVVLYLGSVRFDVVVAYSAVLLWDCAALSLDGDNIFWMVICLEYRMRCDVVFEFLQLVHSILFLYYSCDLHSLPWRGVHSSVWLSWLFVLFCLTSRMLTFLPGVSWCCFPSFRQGLWSVYARLEPQINQQYFCLRVLTSVRRLELDTFVSPEGAVWHGW